MKRLEWENDFYFKTKTEYDSLMGYMKIIMSTTLMIALRRASSNCTICNWCFQSEMLWILKFGYGYEYQNNIIFRY